MPNNRLTQMPKLEMDISIRLTLEEIRALQALACYGTDSFLAVFYEKMGVSSLRPHEKGLRSLFDTIRTELPRLISRYDAARKAFALNNPVILDRATYDETIRNIRATTP